MINTQSLVNMIQEKCGDVSPGYAIAVKTALVQVWAELSTFIDFIELHSPDLYKITLSPDTAIYTIDKPEIRKMRFIGNSKGRKLWNYVEPDTFSTDYAEKSTSESGEVSAFTIMGMKGGKIYIRLISTPLTAADYYLHYTNEGDESNIDNAPAYCGRALYHGAMTILAPPLKNQNDQGRVYWKAMTRDEFEYYKAAKKDIAQVRKVTAPIPDPYMSDYLADQIEDINK